MKKFMLVLWGILIACGVALFTAYHLVNVLPPEGSSYNIQVASVLEDGACGKCHNSNDELFDIQETITKLKNDSIIDEVTLAKIEYATITQHDMPPKSYYLLHWGSSINSVKKKILEEWVITNRKLLYPNAVVSENFNNEPVRPVPESVPTDLHKTELGRKLFFDERLSTDNSLSCNTCHTIAKGGVDNKQYSQGINKTLSEVNTPTVFKACLNFRQFWDGRASDLYSQLNEHLLDPSIMGNSSFKEIIKKLNEDNNLKDDFRKIYDEGITQTTVVETIVEFEKTLVMPDNRFDKYLKGSIKAISEAELIGYNIFKSNGCATCHSGIALGGQSTEKLGIYRDYFKDRGWKINGKDSGLYNQTFKEHDKYRFKVPALRNATLTKPYFHDGSQQTLFEAVGCMGKYQCNKKTTNEETKAIILFLNTLN
jgi:cytochrome c peroxidase